MPRYAYDRLSDESAELLARESSRAFGHTGVTLIFEAGPLAKPHGGVDFAAVRAAIESALDSAPQFRRKLQWIPFENHPIWVDDAEFNLDYHVRHTSLARPGTEDQLRKLTSRLHSQRLDRSRPLWECWVLEGLEDGRFALLLKVHTALADAGKHDLLAALLSLDPDRRRPTPQVFRPQPTPTAIELVRDDVLRQLRLPRQQLRKTARWFKDFESVQRELRTRTIAFAKSLGYSLRVLPETPLNGPVGPHRRVDHLTVPLNEARAIRRALGGTIQDVVLTTLAGAIAGYLRAHYSNPATLDFRVAIPVGVNDEEDDGGGLAGQWTFELPIWETDPIVRFQRLREQTEALRADTPPFSAREIAGEGWTSSRLLSMGARSLQANAPANLRLVNVPGPQSPMYLEGSRMLECYGKVPLAENGGLGVSVLSYDGRLCWELNADFDLVPDLGRITTELRRSFGELRAAVTPRASHLSLARASSSSSSSSE